MSVEGSEPEGGYADLEIGDACEVPYDPWADRRRSLRSSLARARAWLQAIARGEAENTADIACREGFTRARVCQLTRLLTLAPEILSEIDDPTNLGPIPSEHELRKMLRLKTRPEQLARYEELKRAVAEMRPPQKLKRSPESRVRCRGFQHTFAQARRLWGMWESGHYASLEELGKAIGVSGARVSQLLNHLYLAPEIIAALDVPKDLVPSGASSRAIRNLTRIRDLEEQRRHFKSILEC